MQATSLTDADRAILAIESKWWQFPGAKEQRIREDLDVSATRYYQMLNELLEREDVLAAEPILVKRLRHIRATRQRSRSARRVGLDV